MKNFFFLFLLAVLASASATAQTADKDAMVAKAAKTDATNGPTVVALSQTEGVYETTSLRLAAGDYVFAVTNRDVAKDLGFYLQAEDGSQVENSGLSALVGEGQTSRTGVVTLTPGTYQYSCPLNPTPHYELIVE